MSDRPPPLERALGIPEEIGFFVRSAAFGIVTVVVYWLMTYEVAGTVLLGVYGAASAMIALYLYHRWRGAPKDQRQPVEPGTWPPAADGPFANDTGLAPNPILAPLEIAFGVTLALLSIPFGLWMAVIAIFPFTAGALAWFGASVEEHRYVLDRAGSQTPPTPDSSSTRRPVPAAPADAPSHEEPGARAARNLIVVSVGSLVASLVWATRSGRRAVTKVVRLIAAPVIQIALGRVARNLDAPPEEVDEPRR